MPLGLPDGPGHLSRMLPPAVLQPSSIDRRTKLATNSGQFSGKAFCNSCRCRCGGAVIERGESVGKSPRNSGHLVSGWAAATEASAGRLTQGRKELECVAIQVLQASVSHKHPATLNTRGLHLYQFAVGWSITPFASSRAR